MSQFKASLGTLEFKKLKSVVLLDLKDYAQIARGSVTINEMWKRIRSLVITSGGETLWQVHHRYLQTLRTPEQIEKGSEYDQSEYASAGFVGWIHEEYMLALKNNSVKEN